MERRRVVVAGMGVICPVGLNADTMWRNLIAGRPLLGGAGALEAVICIQALRMGLIPPTINLQTPDPACDLDYVPDEARPAKLETALSNSFGFGGHNVSLVLKALQ